MNEIPLCTIRISSELTDEVDSLETPLQIDSINIQKTQSRVIGLDDILLVLTIISGLASGATLIDYGIKAAKAINKWRQDLRAKGLKPKAQLEHPQRPQLDLEKASDEEVEKWFSK